MRLDANLANATRRWPRWYPTASPWPTSSGCSTTVYHVNGEQLLRHRLGATHPANLALPELAEFIKWLLRALKSNGVRDPADVLAHGVQRKAEAAASQTRVFG